jgi:hypothetical protein
MLMADLNRMAANDRKLLHLSDCHSRESGNPVWDQPMHALGPRFRGDDKVGNQQSPLPTPFSPFDLVRGVMAENDRK